MSTMSLRNIFRAPFSIGLAVCALAAAVIKKSAGKTAKSVAASPQSGSAPAKKAEERTEELTRLSHRLLTAGEEEKARIARNLHDGLGSTLTAVNLDLFWVQQRLADQPALASRLARAIEVLASTVEMKRGIIHSLRPAALDNLGLSLAIESHIAEFEKNCAVPIEMDLSAELPPLTSQASIALFRIYQEALAIAVHHAGASLITISLRDERGTVVLQISDDGVGIGTEALSGLPTTLGVLTMRERAAALDGTVTIDRGAAGRGTVVTASLPRAFRETAKAAAGS